MSKEHSDHGASPMKATTTSSTSCPFLITDCDEDDSNSNKVATNTASAVGDTPTKRRFGYSRQEKSLGTLTRRFMSLLRQSKTGILDLKHVSRNNEMRVRRLKLYFYTLGCRLSCYKTKTTNL